MPAHIASGHIVLKKGESQTVSVGGDLIRITEEQPSNLAEYLMTANIDHLVHVDFPQGSPSSPTISPVTSGAQRDGMRSELRATVTCVGDLAAVTYSLFHVG